MVIPTSASSNWKVKTMIYNFLASRKILKSPNWRKFQMTCAKSYIRHYSPRSIRNQQRSRRYLVIKETLSFTQHSSRWPILLKALCMDLVVNLTLKNSAANKTSGLKKFDVQMKEHRNSRMRSISYLNLNVISKMKTLLCKNRSILENKRFLDFT